MPVTTRHHLICAAFCLLAATAPASAGVPLPGGRSVDKVDFERHLVALFGRAGCSAGSCHGSFQGRGGLRLSLFGYDPARDYAALTREAEGRRIDRNNPDASLLLLKATGQMPHGGLKRFDKDSWQYQLIREWLRQGADWKKGSGAVAALRVEPAEYAFTAAGQSGRLRVTAAFADGDDEDVSAFCEFRSNDDAVVEAGPLGALRSLRPGDASVIVSYRGNVTPVRVLVPVQRPADSPYPETPEVNALDHEVFAKLRRLNVVPSDLCSDGEFLRRVTLDTIGTVPTPQEARDFLADDRPDKRARKIEQLLSHPLHAALWATKLCDITGNNTDALENPPQLRPKLSQMWHDWFRKRFAENRPYDEIVQGVLCATSRDGQTAEKYLESFKALEEAAQKGFETTYADKPTLDLFWRRQQGVPINEWGEKTAAAFLGIRLECAQCHKHPFDRWTQADYRGFANIFAAVRVGAQPDAQALFKTENDERTKRSRTPVKGALPPMQVREVFVAPNGAGNGGLPHPDTNQFLPARALGGPVIPVAKGTDPRAALFEWLRSPDNPYFARSFANRVWGHYLGVGVVQPVDDFSLANPPSNPKLLDALAKSFVDSKYDVRALERLILNSRTYQLSSTLNETNRLDRVNYSHSLVRPLMAEAVVDALNDALGMKETFGAGAPPNCKAVEVGASRIPDAQVGYALRIFGRPPRTTACDCERSLEPGLPQKLFLMADPTVVNKVRSPQNRLTDLLKTKADDQDALDELFLATLTRKPTSREREAFAAVRAKARNRAAAFSDTLWALVNTTEFIFNH